MKSTGLFNFSKYFLAILLSASVVFLTSCGDDDEDDNNNNVTPAAPTQSIADLTGSTAGLDSLNKYINNYPDLVALLSDTTATYTVFAPDNQAFINLLATPGFPSDISTINPDIIKGVLSYHVVSGQKIMSGDLGPNMVTLYQDEEIEVNQDGTLKTGSTNQNISVKTADVQATNGVVHIVESVMIPPSVGTTLTPILGTLAGAALLGADFSDLATLIGVADSNVPSGELPIAAILADTSNNYTVFGPPNTVFDAGNVDPTSFDAATARAILLDHVVPGLALSSSLSDGQELITAGGDTLTVSTANGVAIVTPSATIPVVVPDVTDNISNGVIHVIGGIILF